MKIESNKLNRRCISSVIGSFLCLAGICSALVSGPSLFAGKKRIDKKVGPTRVWPEMLVVDDFEHGLTKWENQDAGTLKIVKDPDKGNVLSWVASDDGLGHIVYKNVDKKKIDFSQYQVLMFDVKFSGKRLWNLNPIIQQYPAIYGYRGLFYSLDTMAPFDVWFTTSQDLSKWENAWQDTYSRTNQEFQFEVHQLAGRDHTRVYLDNIRLVKNFLSVPKTVSPVFGRLPDGSQLNHFHFSLVNSSSKAMTITFALDPSDPGTIEHFKLDIPVKSATLLPGERRAFTISMTISKDNLCKREPYYGELARIAVGVKEIPGLILHMECFAGTQPAMCAHPMLLCGPDKMKQLRKWYGTLNGRDKKDKELLNLIKEGGKALIYEPKYPPNAATGIKQDPVSKGKLEKIDVPNLPFNVYQDPISGRAYSGPLYDAGVLGWLKIHMKNAEMARTLGVAYLITGREEFAVAAASILKTYARIYLDLPINCLEQGSVVGSAASGSCRIGGTFMRERVWLSDLAIALDCVRSGGVLTDEELKAIARDVFAPSAMNMMDHKVGAMNLQWMIDNSSLLAGLASDSPGIVSRAMRDRHGILNLIEVGFLEDGHWWENPSYQGVMRINAYPALSVLLHNGLLSWSDKLGKIFSVPYKLVGPDERTPTLGTGGPRKLAMEDAGAMMVATVAKDPVMNWVVNNRKLTRGALDCYLYALFRAPEKGKGGVSPFSEKTVLFPGYGGVAMRIPGTDRYCYFHYGRELTHGHRNKLSVNAYGGGGWFARNVAGGYGHNFHDFLETIASANTIMVDGKNADTDTGELLFLKSLDGIEIASAREMGAYKEIEHERTVILTKGPMIIIDRCVGDSPHTYDWLYHPNLGDLTLQDSCVMEKAAKKLGDSPLYSSLHLAGELKIGNLDWRRKDGSGVEIAFAGNKGELFLLNITETFKPHQSLLWRKRGDGATFATAFYPYRKDQSHKLSITPLDSSDASKSVQGYQVVCPEGTYEINLDYTSSKERVRVTRR